jgi:hypothetical protein
MYITAIILVILLPLLYRRNTEVRLKPFEFSNSFFSESNNAFTNKLSTENALLLLVFSIFIQSLIYFAINFFRDSRLLNISPQDMGIIYSIGGSLFNLILLFICFSVRFTRFKYAIRGLAIVQAAIFTYYSFLQF